jgi:hypothetical protein
MKPINTVRRQNAEVSTVEADGTYNNQCALKGSVPCNYTQNPSNDAEHLFHKTA